jgi:hypothetical protein
MPPVEVAVIVAWAWLSPPGLPGPMGATWSGWKLMAIQLGGLELLSKGALKGSLKSSRRLGLSGSVGFGHSFAVVRSQFKAAGAAQ